MSKLKGIILSIEDTLVPNGDLDREIFAEVSKFIKYLKHKNIEFVVFTNREWSYNKKQSLEDYLKGQWGDFNYFCRATDNSIPAKPRAEATAYILEKMNWESNETIYIGASQNDMQTAVNGGLLFLRATWWANKTDYGFEFESPKDVAKFIDTFCLRDHYWCFQINDNGFELYALAPFSTMKPEYTLYSEDARDAAKHGQGHPEFWVSALVTSLYFTGIHERIDYITTYPGHQAGSGNPIMDLPMETFGKCFRKNYIPNLIERHTTAIKSQRARNTGVSIDHKNQLNTIKLNPTPRKNTNSDYVTSPLRNHKTVLLIDDICTRGYSLESARAYIERTGARVIMAAWLKTINTDIAVLNNLGNFNPYSVNSFTNVSVSKSYSYGNHVIDLLAPAELTKIFTAFRNWDWPAEI